jgi:hypothetical protein
MKRRNPNSIATTDGAAIVTAAAADAPGSRLALKDLLARDPALAELIATSMGLAWHAENAALHHATADNALLEELVPRELAALRTKLARPDDDGLEELLIERVALAWLALTAAEHRRASLWLDDTVPVETARFWDRRVSRLNNDLLRACRALATVRRLLVPAIAQLNIGQQQVNVATLSSEEGAVKD